VTCTPDHASTDDDRENEQVILGVDTHADVHVAAVITMMGVLLGTRSFPLSVKLLRGRQTG
jgi:transposase